MPIICYSTAVVAIPLLSLRCLSFFIVPIVTAQYTTNAGIIASDVDLKTFNNFLATVGMSAGAGQTILAPNNDAFVKYAAADPIMYAKYFTTQDYFLHRRELLQWLLVTEDTYTVDQIFDGARTELENINGNLTVVQNINGNSNSTTVVTLNTTTNGDNTTNYVPNTNETTTVIRAAVNRTINRGNTTNETTTVTPVASNSTTAMFGVTCEDTRSRVSGDSLR
jgi:hypothetical protein